ncbi:hypothetical protein [Klebsiella sp. Q11]|uniref:hypothetical protein n=1 Tax=Klebsiella sp. Q11 TaxID=857461 RepID=UPI003567D052
MTDITKLAQREQLKEKFEAWLSEKPLYARYMHWCDSLNAYDYTGIQLAWEAYQAGGVELVEALEKAQQQSKSDFEIKARLCKESNSLHDRLREAEKRIAELESRTVTVSKSDIFNVPGGETYGDGEMIPVNTLCLYLAEHGIKWEAE